MDMADITEALEVTEDTTEGTAAPVLAGIITTTVAGITDPQWAVAGITVLITAVAAVVCCL